MDKNENVKINKKNELCKAELASGKNKGKICGKKAKYKGYCGCHKDSTN